jgi:hypothetical protein
MARTLRSGKADLQAASLNAQRYSLIRRLGLGSDGRSKIEKAIRSLENHGLITVGANYIGKKDTYG